MITVADEVREALDADRPVVALESTIFSRLGLPAPHGEEALTRCLAAVREGGAVPALTAVVDGAARVGLDPADHDRVLAGEAKCAARDLPVAVARRWPLGATTVSASLALAAATGIEVFATGGIGGVHRDADRTGDVSADLDAIARHPVVTVCAGAKAFLDLGRTLEALESAGVPVLGLATDTFPAFYARSSGLPVPTRVDDVEEAAAVIRAARDLGHDGGLVLAVPVPQRDALDAGVVEQAAAAALDAAAAAGVRGGEVTPFVLERLTAVTGDAALVANVSLAANNAEVAGRLAGALRG